MCEVFAFPLREDYIKYTRAIRGTLFNPITSQYTIYMQDIQNEMEYEIISLYKKNVWLFALAVRFDKKEIDTTKWRRKYEYDTRFYIENCKITKVGVG